MPRGGPQPGSGRPTKAAQLEKERLLAEAIKNGPKISPRVLLQGIKDSPGSTRMEKIKACELYLKLLPEAAPRAEVSASPLRILSIPRDYIVWADGTIRPRPPEIDPNAPVVDGIDITAEVEAGTWKGTPTSVKPPASEPLPEPLPVYDEDHLEPDAPLPVRTMDPAPNVTKLRPYERVYTEGARHDSSRRPSAMSPFTHKPRDPFDAA
jgi:hypothetical protein